MLKFWQRLCRLIAKAIELEYQKAGIYFLVAGGMAYLMYTDGREAISWYIHREDSAAAVQNAALRECDSLNREMTIQLIQEIKDCQTHTK